jgi:uncharacterized protein (DUF1330 family)
MAAYLIADIEVTDAEAFERYRAGVPAVIERFGGRYVVRGGAAQNLEGDWQPRRMVILEFPTMEKLKAFYDSDDYAELLAARLAATDSRTILVEGV